MKIGILKYRRRKEKNVCQRRETRRCFVLTPYHKIAHGFPSGNVIPLHFPAGKFRKAEQIFISRFEDIFIFLSVSRKRCLTAHPKNRGAG
jgi:hypothetical protein